MAKPLKVLIADDNESDRLILNAIVKREGHETATAEDGVIALKLFEEFEPDIVLLDALMPNMDGFEAAQNMKRMAGDELVPIIFLTSLQDAASLARCLDSGGDDFLSKPYNRIILKAKLHAYSRMRRMHSDIQEHNRQLIVEQQTAKTVFDNVAHAGCLDANNICYSLSPLAVFNGDTVLAEYKPDGGMHLFLGDFTGHGLPAAIGAMPVAEMVYGMTAKGFSMEEILREINRKLGRILPTGVFCCGCMVEMDFYDHTAKIWLGGLPDVVVYRSKNGELEKLASANLPLGVVSDNNFKPTFHEITMEVGDRLFLWSDGIHEARNEDGDMFGEERLMDVISHSRSNDNIFKKILSSVDEFIGTQERDDDITLLEATMIDHTEIQMPELASDVSSTNMGPMSWTLEYQLKTASLKNYNPLPLVLQIITEVEGLRPLRAHLYTLLAELFSNALEHGILGMDSKLKSSPEGFAEYYRQREERLENLHGALIRINVEHEPFAKGGKLRIRFEDSGPGFDYQSVIEKQRTNLEYCGRGLPLIQSICSLLEYEGKGNIVHAEVIWPKAKVV